MRFNILKFGDTFFLQKIGTAMGTSCGVIFANLYFAWHENTITYLSTYLHIPLIASTHPQNLYCYIADSSMIS
jgi:hypothetical protein